MNVTCPVCGSHAKRDPDTLDTFVCSSWYFLRYLDNRNEQAVFDSDWINRMAPVDVYVGGPEHAAMHLLYARFFVKALRDMGLVNFGEPFTKLVHQGMILGSDGNKMSKSLGNTVSPDGYIQKYGSDIFRMYLGFGFAYTDGGPWNDDGLKAVARFLSRVERMTERVLELASKSVTVKPKIIPPNNQDGFTEDDKVLNYARNYAIKSAGADIERFQFNTAISRTMELLNALSKYDQETGTAGAETNRRGANLSLFFGTFVDLIRLISPFVPHLAEEVWESLGLPYSIFNANNWPVFNESALAKDMTEMAVSVNGTVRFRIEVPSSAEADEIEATTRADERLLSYLGSAEKRDGKPLEIQKVIVIRGRLVNVVAKAMS
jgi:leucyl-tRNA synthetase